MLNFESIKKMMPEYLAKSSKKKLKTKRGNNIQLSSKDTIDRFIAALSGDWLLCKDLIDSTGLTQGTISRAAAHLMSDSVIDKKVIQEGRCKNTYYKLT